MGGFKYQFVFACYYLMSLYDTVQYENKVFIFSFCFASSYLSNHTVYQYKILFFLHYFGGHMIWPYWKMDPGKQFS